MIRIQEIKVPLEEHQDLSKIKDLLCDKLDIQASELLSFKIVKKAVDARKKSDICYKFNFDLELTNNAKEKILKENKGVLVQKDEKVKLKITKKKKVLVVGSGPSGLFCALTLAESGVQVILLERGQEIEKRVRTVESFLEKGIFNPNSNIQFGEGGAGTFSDGKLNTGIKSPLIAEVLQTFYQNGAPEEILYETKAHIGTDKLRQVVVNIREQIKKEGGEVYFNSEFIGFKKGDKITAIYKAPDGEKEIVVDDIVLALGYSARNTLRALYKQGLEFKQKPFSVGYRIEHLQEDINKAQYGSFYDSEFLPPADYKLFAHLPNGRTVYTFCMCPGGEVVPSISEDGQIVTNGMSYHARDGKNANSAVLVNVEPKDYKSEYELAGLDFQEELERKAFNTNKGKFVCSKVGDFLKGVETKKLGRVVPTIKPSYVLGRVDNLLPKELASSIKEGIKEFGKKLKGFDCEDAILTGIETRSSAPFMIVRKENMQTNIPNIYAVGEGAGMAGGIISSAVDGKKIALKIIEKYLEV